MSGPTPAEGAFGRAAQPDPTLADLAREERWVAWAEERRGDKPDAKPTKVPKNPRAPGANASSTNPSTWGPRALAERAWAGLKHRPAGGRGGVGAMLGDLGDGTTLSGFDLDRCRDPETGTLTPWAVEVLDNLATHAEVSPSGCGVKGFLLCATADAEALRAEMGAAGRK
jgi:primase-polymerase (primpol)-like protein